MQEFVAVSPARGRDDGAPGNENSTEMVSNLPRHLQSHSPSVATTRPTCVGGVALHTDSRHSCALPFTKKIMAIAVEWNGCGRRNSEKKGLCEETIVAVILGALRRQLIACVLSWGEHLPYFCNGHDTHGML